MSNLNIHRSHDLGIEKTRSLVDKLMPIVGKDYGMTCHLNRQNDRDIVSIKRSGFDGTLVATANHIELNGKVGFLLSALLPKIKSTIETNLDELIEA